jgi:tetratricopeptide (TPR) repeat protein
VERLRAELQQAYQWLQAGRANEALKLADSATKRHPQVPDAVHLLALCCEAVGDIASAQTYFTSAKSLVPRNVEIICNYASLLNAQGRTEESMAEYKSAIDIDSDYLIAWLGFGNAALNGGHPRRALEAYEKILKRFPTQAGAWHGKGSAHMALEDHPDAQVAFEKAVELQPANTRAWLNLGMVHRFQGNLSAAIRCFSEAEKRGFVGPELEDCKATILLEQGKIPECLAAYRTINRIYPHYVQAHEALVRLTWQHEPEANPLELCRLAADRQIENIPLQLCYLRLLSQSERWNDLIERVGSLRKKTTLPAVLPLEAVAWGGLGEFSKAHNLFEQSVKSFPDDAALRIAFARNMFRTKDFDGAAIQSQAAVDIDPDDQMAWAYLGTAWRLLDDPREDWLHGYDRFVQPIEVELPAEFATREAFGAALEEELLSLHRTKKEPIEQSLRKGTQTENNLFANPEGLVKIARDQISKSIRRFYRDLPKDDGHPFLRRTRTDFRYSGAWSVRLSSSGFHINHMHPKGWISSAFYVALPPSVGRDNSDHQGWIQFGQPPLELGLDLEPRRYIQPRVGILALFPSYTWHGTVPFDDKAFRMTMAFDMVPKKQ